MDNSADQAGRTILGMSMSGGELQRIAGNADTQQIVATMNEIIDRLNNTLKSQVFADGTAKRYVQGYAPGRWPGGDFGIAISAEGQDVLGVSFEDLIFAWDFSTNQQYIRGGVQTYYDKYSGETALQIGEMEDKNMAFKTFGIDGAPMGLFGQSPRDRKGGVWTVGAGKNVDEKLKGS